MKKMITPFLLIFSLTSCCDDEIIFSYEIPENAPDLIPFEQDTSLTYVSQQDFSFTASAKAKRMNVYTERMGPESCDLIANETLTSSVFINRFEYGFEFILKKDLNDRLLFSIKRFYDGEGYRVFQIEGCEDINTFDEDQFTDIEINGLYFENILLFKSCGTDPDINQIVYSPEKGIEYIDYTDGRFLRLVHN